MKNNELRKKTQKQEESCKAASENRIRLAYKLDGEMQELFKINESHKLYTESIGNLRVASAKEKENLTTLRMQVKELQKLLHEEASSGENYKSLVVIQRKKLNA